MNIIVPVLKWYCHHHQDNVLLLVLRYSYVGSANSSIHHTWSPSLFYHGDEDHWNDDHEDGDHKDGEDNCDNDEDGIPGCKYWNIEEEKTDGSEMQRDDGYEGKYGKEEGSWYM